MSGALVDLVSKGVQDVYLSGNPEVSFYRQNYKRHTNFSIKPVELKAIGGTQNPSSEIVLPIEKKGDLLTYVWCSTDDNGVSTDTVTSNIQVSDANTPTEFSLHIGGVEIDRQDAFFMNYLWPKFFATASSKNQRPSAGSANFFPLHFFHCDTQTTPLPLVAMQYQEAEIRVKHSPNCAPGPIRYYANYVMLDTDERKFFTEQKHEFLITQTQRILADTTRSDLTYLNHPVKALSWGKASTLTTSNVQLNLNGTDVFDNRLPGKYFNTATRYYHTKFNSDTDNNLYMYSFALYPGEHQPTGSCNFSRLDNGKLTWTCDNDPLHVYAYGYNILTVDRGMSGLKFSN